MWRIKINSNDIKNETNIWLASMPILTPSAVNRERSDVYMYDGGMIDRMYYHSFATMDVTYHGLDFDDLLGVVSTKYVSDALVGSASIGSVLTNILPEYATLTLYESHDTEYVVRKVYKVMHAYITSTERKKGNYGRVTVRYELYPYRFDASSPSQRQLSNGNNSITNNGDTAFPIYYITVASAGSIKVDNNTAFQFLSSSIGKDLIIDPRKQTTTTINSTTPIDSDVNGNYKDLYIPRGTHNIALSGATEAILLWMTGVYI